MENNQDPRKYVLTMTEEAFEELCAKCTPEQVKIMQGTRFFHKLFNNPLFYKYAEQTIGEAAYEALRA